MTTRLALIPAILLALQLVPSAHAAPLVLVIEAEPYDVVMEPGVDAWVNVTLPNPSENDTTAPLLIDAGSPIVVLAPANVTVPARSNAVVTLAVRVESPTNATLPADVPVKLSFLGAEGSFVAHALRPIAEGPTEDAQRPKVAVSDAGGRPYASQNAIPEFRATPSGVFAPPGAAWRGFVEIPNPTGRTLDIDLRAVGWAWLQFDQPTIRIDPGAHARVGYEAELPVAAHAGYRSVRIEARDHGDPNATALQECYVWIIVDDAPPTSPQATLTSQPLVALSVVGMGMMTNVGNEISADSRATNLGAGPVDVPVELHRGLSGWDVTVSPASLHLDANATATLHVTASPQATWTNGSALVLVGSGPVRSFIVVGLNATMAPTRAPAPVILAAERALGGVAALPRAALFASSVGVGALAIVATHRRRPLLFAGLYARIAKSRLLEHPLRARIRRAVEARPGITHNELQRDVDAPTGAFQHHVRRLEKAGLVLVVEDGQRRRYYAPGADSPEARPALDARIAALLATAPKPARVADLARALGVSRQSAHYHAKRMAEAGRLVVLDDGRVTLAAAAPRPTA